MKNFKNINRYISIIFKDNKSKACIAFFLLMLVSILNLVIPQLTIRILDDAIQSGATVLLIKLILIYGIISLLSPIINLRLGYLYSKMKKRVSVKLKMQLLKHITKLSGNYFTEMKTGNLLTIIGSDLYTIENFGIDLLFSLIVDFFTAVVAIYFLVKMQIDLFVIIIVLQILIIFAQLKFTNLIASKTKEIRNDAGKISNITQEFVSNIMNVLISKSGFLFFKKLIKGEQSLVNKCIKLDVTISESIAVANILNSLMVLVIYGYGGYKVIKGSLKIGELIAFQQYAGMLIGPCMSIIRSNTRIQQTAVSVNRVFEVLDEPIIIKQMNNRIRCEHILNKNIIFNSVSFSYDDTGKIIDDIDMVFETGKITAIVGASGCGKSTIAKLLYRLWDVDEGEITIGKVPIQELNLKSLRKNVSVITQDLLLFDDTLINNLALGNRNISFEYIKEICIKVGIYDFIMGLPKGFSTIIGEKGVKLSGGQRQRISIARELLNNTEIMVFDEATSALDNISQNEIIHNIKSLLNKKTVIIIAHRLSTIKDADKIYVMSDGEIVEEGTHDKLIMEKKYYYSFLNNEKN